MSEYESFLLILYYAKLKWMSFQSGYIQALWGDRVQNQINALSNIAPVSCNLAKK